ncbi:MAG: 2-oxo acid dehydrogenase subunit E2 [Deltaproteobacteria bacterium]|nr:2-oxo acid dehydrogenase subunit E2 [Deltaproteobacteria bacterium]
MAYEFKLPDVGEGMAEGEIVRWLVKEGDDLKQDQPMVEVMTDKATVEIATPHAGRVLERRFKEGERCPVGQVLIVIETAAAPATTKPAEVSSTDKTPGPVAVGAAPGSVLATPATRRLARELGVDLVSVKGSGPGGQITPADVRAATLGATADKSISEQLTPGPAALSSADVRIPFRGVRRMIAEHMVKTQREVAQFTYVEEIDCTELVELRDKAEARLIGHGVKLSYLPFFVKAAVEALKKHPQLNATLDEAAGEIVQRREYHIGIAAQTPEGLMVPVIRHADRRTLLDLAREVDRLAVAAKNGRVSQRDLGGSTFTITSLGALGGIVATPIVNYPEVAILAIHKIAKRPAVIDDKIVIRDRMNLSLSVDHRLVDGHDAATFVAELKGSLETPGLIFLDAT